MVLGFTGHEDEPHIHRESESGGAGGGDVSAEEDGMGTRMRLRLALVREASDVVGTELVEIGKLVRNIREGKYLRATSTTNETRKRKGTMAATGAGGGGETGGVVKGLVEEFVQLLDLAFSLSSTDSASVAHIHDSASGAPSTAEGGDAGKMAYGVMRASVLVSRTVAELVLLSRELASHSFWADGDLGALGRTIERVKSKHAFLLAEETLAVCRVVHRLESWTAEPDSSAPTSSVASAVGDASGGGGGTMLGRIVQKFLGQIVDGLGVLCLTTSSEVRTSISFLLFFFSDFARLSS
jgi:hypothetical protein